MLISCSKISGVTEMSLTANQNKTALLARRSAALQWHESSSNMGGGVAGGLKESADEWWWRKLPALEFAQVTTVTLGPLEIKTFVVQY